MNGLLFAYTIAILFVCVVAAAFSLSAWAVSRRTRLIPLGALFLFYAGDIAGIFGSEWLVQNLPFSAETYYEVENPIYHTIMGAGVLLCAWLVLLDILDKHDMALMVVPVVVFAGAQVLILTALPYGPLRQWLYYTMRQVFLIGSLGYALVCYLRSTDAVFSGRLGRYRKNYLVLVALTFVILLEDCWVILVMPVPGSAELWPSLYLSSRNFSENLMMLFVAYLTIRDSFETLAMRFNQPPVAQHGREDDLKRHIEERLLPYAQAHGLSPREREILAMVLEGQDNRGIANELVLSEGTIKTHVHNILKKTGAASRDELKRDFWST